MSQVNEFISQINFNEVGLVPVIAQDSSSNEVLMLAWMNAEAVQLTIDTGLATYFSRSRNKIWVKGEESGNGQSVLGLRLDCDGDALLLTVDQSGPACHTGNPTCFFEQGIQK
jgi:phosphoribosyl-AMP cyclohydrolase